MENTLSLLCRVLLKLEFGEVLQELVVLEFLVIQAGCHVVHQLALIMSLVALRRDYLHLHDYPMSKGIPSTSIPANEVFWKGLTTVATLDTTWRLHTGVVRVVTLTMTNPMYHTGPMKTNITATIWLMILHELRIPGNLPWTQSSLVVQKAWTMHPLITEKVLRSCSALLLMLDLLEVPF